MPTVPRRWWIAAYWFALACTVRAHHHAGHPLVPVPFPLTAAGSYRHTSSVVNVPIHQERLIIIKKPEGYHQHDGHAHEYRHAQTQGRSSQPEYKHKHGPIQAVDYSHGYREQESRIPFTADIRPFLYQVPRSHQNYPYFQDVGFLLDPRFIQQSLWLEQFPDLL